MISQSKTRRSISRLQDFLSFLIIALLAACGSVTSSPNAAPEFDFSLEQASISVAAGSSRTVTARLAAQAGFNDSVLVTAGDLPEGVSVSPLNLAAGETTGTLTFEVAATATPGRYTAALSARSGVISKTAQVTLEITAPTSEPSFGLSIDPTETSIAPGGSRSVTVTLIRQNSFAEAVMVTVRSLPTHVSPTPLIIAAGETIGTLTLIATDEAAATEATVSITGTSGELSDSANLQLTVVEPAPAPDFSLSLEPTSLSLSKNASQNVTVSITRLNNFAEAVIVTAANLPVGVSADEFTIGADASSGTLTLSAGEDASTSASEVTVTATGAGLSRDATLSLNVTAPTPSFSLSLDPTELVLEPGESKEVTVSLDKSNGFDSAVAVTVTGLSAGVTASSLTIAAGASAGTLSLSAAADAETGSAKVNVRGSGGVLFSEASLSLNVKAPESFSLSLAPTSVSLSRGASQNVTVTLSKEGGFDAAVAVTVSGLPTGVSAGPLTIATGESVGTLKLSASATTSAGDATIKVTAKSGDLSDDADLALNVTGPAPTFEISLSETSVTAARETSKEVTVTLARKNGFSGPVSVNVSGLPTGVSTDDLTIADGATSGKLKLAVSGTAKAGTSGLSVTGTSGSLSQSAALSLTVTNQEPTFEAEPGDQKVTQNTDSPTKTVEVSYALSDDQASSLSVVASSSNTDIVANSSFTCTSTKCTFDIERSEAGQATITLTVTDSDSAKTTSSFDVTVGPRLVTNNKDSGDGSLRQTIQDADVGDVIGFADSYAIGLQSELTIDKNITIDSVSNSTVLDGGNNVRILTVESGAKVTVKKVDFISGFMSEDGGCIYNAGTLLLEAVTVEDCSSDSHGGGIYSAGTLTLQDSQVSANSAGAGGGIYTLGSATLTGSTVRDNSAEMGGGIRNGGGSLIVESESVVSGNSAEYGGGLETQDGTVTIQSGSEISGNEADYGAGIYLWDSESTSEVAELTVTDSSVTKNTAASDGGGVFVKLGTLVMKGSSTVAQNEAVYGGGIYSYGGSLDGATDGENVKDNSPDNIFEESS